MKKYKIQLAIGSTLNANEFAANEIYSNGLKYLEETADYLNRSKFEIKDEFYAELGQLLVESWHYLVTLPLWHLSMALGESLAQLIIEESGCDSYDIAEDALVIEYDEPNDLNKNYLGDLANEFADRVIEDLYTFIEANSSKFLKEGCQTIELEGQEIIINFQEDFISKWLNICSRVFIEEF